MQKIGCDNWIGCGLVSSRKELVFGGLNMNRPLFEQNKLNKSVVLT